MSIREWLIEQLGGELPADDDSQDEFELVRIDTTCSRSWPAPHASRWVTAASIARRAVTPKARR
jgi:hypothetical protein